MTALPKASMPVVRLLKVGHNEGLSSLEQNTM